MTHVRNDYIWTIFWRVITLKSYQLWRMAAVLSAVYIRYNANILFVLNDSLLFSVPHVSALIISRCQALVRMKNKPSVQYIVITLREISTL
jgi:hypothetical protein